MPKLKAGRKVKSWANHGFEKQDLRQKKAVIKAKLGLKSEIIVLSYLGIYQIAFKWRRSKATNTKRIFRR